MYCQSYSTKGTNISNVCNVRDLRLPKLYCKHQFRFKADFAAKMKCSVDYSTRFHDVIEKPNQFKYTVILGFINFSTKLHFHSEPLLPFLYFFVQNNRINSTIHHNLFGLWFIASYYSEPFLSSFHCFS